MKRYFIFTFLISFISFGAWAMGNNEGDVYQSSSTGIEWQTIGPLQVEPNAEIVSIFEANGVDGEFLHINRASSLSDFTPF